MSIALRTALPSRPDSCRSALAAEQFFDDGRFARAGNEETTSFPAFNTGNVNVKR